MKQAILCTIICSTCIIASFAQNIRYVKEDGTGNGTSWAEASSNLQAIINASEPNDEIWVAEGIYTPTTWFIDPTNFNNSPSRLSSFTLKSGIKLYGGFPNTGNPQFGERNPSLHATSLSGEIGDPSDLSDNCYHVLFLANVSDFILDGFVITSGTANATSSPENFSYVSALSMNVDNFRGAGMMMHGGSGEINNCKWMTNESSYEGGACYVLSATLSFSSNTFENNAARVFGAGVFGNNCTFNFEENAFRNNSVRNGINYAFPMPTPNYYASGAGLAIFQSNSMLINNVFENNEAILSNNTTNANGGAVHISDGSHQIIANAFDQNSATYLPTGVQVCNGGALYIQQAEATIEQNTFSNNLSHGSGGAVYLLLGSFFLNGNRFSNNECVGNGGAIYIGNTEATIINNIIENNSCEGRGAAIHCTHFNFQDINYIVNNTIYGNTTSNTQGTSGISLSDCLAHIRNNVFYQNAVNGSTTAMNSELLFTNASSSTFTYNLYQSGSSGSGNIGFDANNNPFFVDASNGNYALSSNSPCINAGLNAHYFEEFGSIDYEGNTRIYGDNIDMGAIEFQSSPTAINEINNTQAELKIFPNPVASNEAIHITSLAEQTIRIIDCNGKVCVEKNLKQGTFRIVEDLNPGLYLIVSSQGTMAKLVIR